MTKTSTHFTLTRHQSQKIRHHTDSSTDIHNLYKLRKIKAVERAIGYSENA